MANFRTIICVLIASVVLVWCVKIWTGHNRYELVMSQHTFYKLDRQKGRVWRIRGTEQLRVTTPDVE